MQTKWNTSKSEANPNIKNPDKPVPILMANYSVSFPHTEGLGKDKVRYFQLSITGTLFLKMLQLQKQINKASKNSQDKPHYQETKQ